MTLSVARALARSKKRRLERQNATFPCPGTREEQLVTERRYWHLTSAHQSADRAGYLRQQIRKGGKVEGC